MRWDDRNRAVITFTSSEDAYDAIPALELHIRSWETQAFTDRGLDTVR